MTKGHNYLFCTYETYPIDPKKTYPNLLPTCYSRSGSFLLLLHRSSSLRFLGRQINVIVILLILAVLMQQHIFPRTESELDDVLLQQLNVLLRIDLLVVDERSVGRLHVQHVGTDALRLGAIFLRVWDESILKDCVLFGARRMIDGNVADLAVATNQIAALSVDEERGQCLVALERIQSPATLGLPCFLGLGVLDDDSVDFVRVFRQFSAQSKVGFLFLDWSGGCFIGGFILGRRTIRAFAPPIVVPGVLLFGIPIPISFRFCVWTSTLFTLEPRSIRIAVFALHSVASPVVPPVIPPIVMTPVPMIGVRISAPRRVLITTSGRR